MEIGNGQCYITFTLLLVVRHVGVVVSCVYMGLLNTHNIRLDIHNVQHTYSIRPTKQLEI